MLHSAICGKKVLHWLWEKNVWNLDNKQSDTHSITFRLLLGNSRTLEKHCLTNQICCCIILRCVTMNLKLATLFLIEFHYIFIIDSWSLRGWASNWCMNTLLSVFTFHVAFLKRYWLMWTCAHPDFLFQKKIHQHTSSNHSFYTLSWEMTKYYQTIRLCNCSILNSDHLLMDEKIL